MRYIAEVVPRKDYMLYIKSEDGQAGLFDMKAYLDAEAFAPLRDEDEFRRLRNGRYFIEWECGADLSADTIYARWKPLSGHHDHTSGLRASGD